MDFSKCDSNSKATGMKDGMIDFLLTIRRPDADTDIPKLRKFYKQGGHLTMEVADEKNNRKWFDACVEKGFMDAMAFHREGVRGVFPMDNFDEWVSGTTTYYILWDTDGLEEGHPLLETYLPQDYHKKVELPNFIKKDEIADYLSDEYGLCVASISKTP